MRKRSTPTSGSARVDAALVEADEARWCLPAGLVFAKSAARQRPYLYRVTGPPASERPRGPLPPIEASGTGVWAWVHLAFHGRCTTAAAGLAREGRGRHKCPAPLPLAVPPLLRSAQLPLALHSRARATRAPVTASGCSATAGATIPLPQSTTSTSIPMPWYNGLSFPCPLPPFSSPVPSTPARRRRRWR